MIFWKHPEAAIKAAAYMHSKGYDFELTMVGDGPLLPELKSMTSGKPYSDKIHFTGIISNNEVLNLMRNSDVFLLTSDQREGFGCSGYEAMANGMLLVANSFTGIAKTFLENRENSLLFETDNDLNEAIDFVFRDGGRGETIRENGRKTIIDLWNADVGASRFLQLSKSLLSKSECIFETGPLSSL